eukprot:TRINITY_DN1833_c0_g1_i5.p1 TRINITY_DN1833_c0_g1~~TRINITY_DN1833_c0_g1_i5.p1  ORF type:complete len:341 (+),score=64.00 TRINITY_DN1833_c0_g1_i5:309-1331(+)
MKPDTSGVRKKVLILSYGGYEKLEVVEDAIPVPQEGEVLVQVRAVGVNYADVCIRMGLYASAEKYVGLPITPGFEFAGVLIKKAGDARTELSVGARVLGLTRFGAYASYVAVPANQVFALPEKMSYEQGAAFPSVFLTAYYAMFELVHPRKGKSASVLDLGAETVIDKSTEALWESAEKASPDGYDAVFDANGVSTLKESYNHLAVGGKLVVYGFHSMLPKTGGTPNWLKLGWDYIRTPSFNPLEMTGANRSVMGFNLSYMFDNKELLEEGMNTLLSYVVDGLVDLDKIMITTFDLGDVAAAHTSIESGTTIGKLVLVPCHCQEVPCQCRERLGKRDDGS